MAGGKGGRKRTPDHLKLVSGSAREHPGRLNKNAPKPAKTLPEPPEWLSDVAAEWFRKTLGILDGMGIASSDHVDMLSIAATRYDEALHCTAVLEDVGRVYKVISVTGSEMFKSRPEVAQRNEALRHLQSLLAEFGLSPSSMGKVNVDRGQIANAFAEFG